MLLGTAEREKLLKRVSRSFYLTLRILPPSIRKPIGLAYLLARASDTIADTRLIAVPRRSEALLQFRKSIQQACDGTRFDLPNLGDIAEAQGTTPGERALLER